MKIQKYVMSARYMNRSRCLGYWNSVTQDRPYSWVNHRAMSKAKVGRGYFLVSKINENSNSRGIHH